jgi:hypothetical protein
MVPPDAGHLAVGVRLGAANIRIEHGGSKYNATIGRSLFWWLAV